MVAVALASWATAVAVPAGATATASAKCTTTWALVKSPNRGTDSNVLYKVSATSPTDVWAVGYSRAGSVNHTLAEHYNGTSWAIVPTPSQGSSFFFAVSARTSTDVWAVGGATAAGGTRKNLIEHFDGTAWTIVPSPSIKNIDGNLAGVDALSATDAYAVGYNGQEVLLHWDGAQWSKLKPPRPTNSTFTALFGITATSASDVWLFGDSFVGAAGSALIERGSGNSFSLGTSPALGGPAALLGSGAAITGTDVWAVGQFSPTSGPTRTLAEHWNGTAWSVVASPSPGVNNDEFSAVAAIGTNDVWATGYTNNGSSWRTLIEQWNGSAWTIATSPSPGAANDVLWGVTTSANSGWAVGSTTPSEGAPTRTLIERACGI